MYKLDRIYSRTVNTGARLISYAFLTDDHEVKKMIHSVINRNKTDWKNNIIYVSYSVG